MNPTVREIQIERYELWLKEWKDGMGFCRHCDKDYTNKQTLVINEDKHCPYCKKEEDKQYYYCKDHGQSACLECDHGGNYR